MVHDTEKEQLRDREQDSIFHFKARFDVVVWTLMTLELDLIRASMIVAVGSIGIGHGENVFYEA